jgi:quercetin 2,3-dioxygenase
VRTLIRTIPSVPTSDGAGVKLRRSLGGGRGLQVDPFLLLDEFYSDDPSDYLAGFPAHPHRGFETVTYMLAGHMRHEDHLGNRGDLQPGDVQWMTAARGIVHSEMPQQTQGRMRGFQLWINLPSGEKMGPARYRDIPAREVPTLELAGGGRVRVIAGTVTLDDKLVSGPVNSSTDPRSTDPLYLDIELPPDAALTVPLARGRNALLYVYDGEVQVGGTAGGSLAHGSAGVLSDGDDVGVRAGSNAARLLLLAARPIGEPVVQYGPFVMNSSAQIEQAIKDFQSGQFTA